MVLNLTIGELPFTSEQQHDRVGERNCGAIDAQNPSAQIQEPKGIP